jgi:hypothetical protein
MSGLNSEKNASAFYLTYKVRKSRILFIGRVSKYVTNESKIAVMDVIGFLCVLLGSSTVQFHDFLCNRRACACSGAGFSSQSGNRV